jgi:hypothetical protein
MEAPTTCTPTPAGVVADAHGELASLGEVLWAARSPAELVGAVEELEALRARLAALEASVLAEIDARQVARTHLAWGSTSDWFTHLAGAHRGPGHRTVRQASVLVTELPRTHTALARGTVSPEQAAVIVDAVDGLPHQGGLREQGEDYLLDAATRLNATDLAKAARHLLEVADPEKAERDAEKAADRETRAAHLGRFLAISEDGAGGVRVRGRGTVEDAAKLKAALLPLTAPAPATDPDTCEEGVDPRDHGARLWDALIGVADHALATDLAPDSHGARPRLNVTTSLDVLRGQLDRATLAPGTSTTDDGLDLAPSVIRRLACDADIIPVALGTHGEVLDVGRTHRLVTPPLWRALVCRDQHCAFPGCTRPPVMGHAHHITHWANGGTTSLDNLVLLCGHHHRVVHHTPWKTRFNPHDRKPEFLPPPKPGQPPGWIRHRPRRE